MLKISKMRIGIDITFLFDQYARRGIGTYGRELITNLLADRNITWVLFGFKNLEHNLEELRLRKAKNIEFVSLGRPRNSSPWNILFYKLFYSRKISREKLDAFFAPHFERGLPVGKVKTAVTVHDIIPYITHNYSQRNKLTNLLKGIFYKYNLNRARKADLIITDSEFSKRELVTKGGFDENKVRMIHLGLHDRFRSKNITVDERDVRRVLIIYKISKPYLLYYGGLEKNKNISNLIISFAQTSTRYPDLKLVIAGKDFKVGWDNKPKPQTPAAAELLELIAEYKLKHKVILTGEVEDNHMPIILKSASAFIHLSSYEGFGFSVLEGLAAGTPVIASRRSSYPEVLGDAPKYVNPEDTEKIAAAIHTVLSDGKAASTMVNKGIKISDKYNWQKTAELTKNELLALCNMIVPKKIAYLIPYFHPYKGGAENNCLELSRRMAKLGHDVTVLTSKASEADLSGEEIFSGIKIRRYKRLNNQYYLAFYPGLLFGLLRSRYDLIHVHGFGFIWQDFCLLLKKLTSPRQIMLNSPHGPFMTLSDYTLFQRLLKFTYTIIQKIFLRFLYTAVIQDNTRQHEWITTYGISMKKIHFIPNGIPEKFLKKTDTATFVKEHKLSRKTIISFIGRYEKYKGLEYLLEALSETIKTHKNIKLFALGESGAYLTRLQEMVNELQLAGHCELLVGAKDEIKEQILSVSDIYVSASQWEGFGISLLEAMAKNNAVISTRTEGSLFLISEEENGLLFDYGDVKELEALLARLLTDKELRIKMQQANIEKAKQFTWEKISEQYNYLLKKLSN